jgi:hypothetical protein
LLRSSYTTSWDTNAMNAMGMWGGCVGGGNAMVSSRYDETLCAMDALKRFVPVGGRFEAGSRPAAFIAAATATVS